jgi:hypothetical protein
MKHTPYFNNKYRAEDINPKCLSPYTIERKTNSTHRNQAQPRTGQEVSHTHTTYITQFSNPLQQPTGTNNDEEDTKNHQKSGQKHVLGETRSKFNLKLTVAISSGVTTEVFPFCKGGGDSAMKK